MADAKQFDKKALLSAHDHGNCELCDQIESELAALRLLKDMDVLEACALGTFLKGGDIPSTIDKARGALVRRVLEAERQMLEQVRNQQCASSARGDNEGALRLAQSALRQWTDLYGRLQNDSGEVVSRKLDYNLPPANHLKALEAIEDALSQYVGLPSSKDEK